MYKSCLRQFTKETDRRDIANRNGKKFQVMQTILNDQTAPG
jgi:hypothetical protein